MNKKIALLFSGQGAQAVGMGKDLAAEFPAAADLFKQADDILGFRLSKTAFEGPADELTKTSVCQPALYVHGLACLAVLKEKLPQFVFHAAAGLSLGEFTAHAAATTFDFDTGLELVAKRSQAMQEACDRTHGSMAAIIGGTEESKFANSRPQLVSMSPISTAQDKSCSPGRRPKLLKLSRLQKSTAPAKRWNSRLQAPFTRA